MSFISRLPRPHLPKHVTDLIPGKDEIKKLLPGKVDKKELEKKVASAFGKAPLPPQTTLPGLLPPVGKEPKKPKIKFPITCTPLPAWPKFPGGRLPRLPHFPRVPTKPFPKLGDLFKFPIRPLPGKSIDPGFSANPKELAKIAEEAQKRVNQAHVVVCSPEALGAGSKQ